ncbi:MAG TPA: hypothetical protein VG013_16955 [Gemmataceae bacterium]|nr:hypothetical protein [Gemmataceae bacterium]
MPADLFPLGGRDRSWNAHADNFLRANRPHLEALDIRAELVGTPEEIGLQLKPGGTIGAVPLRAPDSWRIGGGVVVRPRFGWNDIGPLLHTVGWAASPRILAQPLVPGSAREVPPWVLAGPVLQRLGRLLQEIRRGFRMQEEVRTQPRGQIMWQQYLRQQMARGAFHQLPCRFPELGPDLLLRAYLRWGLQRVNAALLPYSGIDPVARRLVEQAQLLVQQVQDIAPRVPDRRALDQLLHDAGLPSEYLLRGLEALGWLAEDRGLAGLAETDGLAWSLRMHELFECWVEHLVGCWAHRIGGQLASGRRGQTVFPIHWRRPAAGSLSSLVPDLIVRTKAAVFIFDAKYKGHFEEFDDRRWASLREEMQAEHRHDLHQILAYAALFGAPRVVSVLVYPMHGASWRRLAERDRVVTPATLTSAGRQLGLALVGVPMELRGDQSAHGITRAWSMFSSN